MAILKDLIVLGVSKFLGTVYGEKFVKSGGTSSLFLKADGSVDNSTYLTTETDPTVPSWAKQSSKPSYTASEVGAYTETQVNNLLATKADLPLIVTATQYGYRNMTLGDAKALVSAFNSGRECYYKESSAASPLYKLIRVYQSYPHHNLYFLSNVVDSYGNFDTEFLRFTYDATSAAADSSTITGTMKKASDVFYTESETDTLLADKADKTLVVTVTTAIGGVFQKDKTYAELLAAYNAGQNVSASFQGAIVPLVTVGNNTLTFIVTINGSTCTITINSSDQVTVTVVGLQTELTFDSSPSANSTNPVTSGGVYTALAGKEDKVVSVNIGFGQAITTDGVAATEYTKIANAVAATDKPLVRDTDGSILHVVAGDNTGEYKLMGFDDYGYVRVVTIGDGVMGSDYEVLDVQSMPIEQFTESDPTVPSYVKSITQANITAWNGKQDALVSGTNIKTVNNNSLVGSGNVQVGDITGEEVENAIIDLLTSIISDALRKTPQLLTLSEQSQVLNNLGISNLVKDNELKTINGSSIVGRGNIEVTVVDGGDINVALSTGTSLTYVMSQRAVSEQLEKLDEEDLESIEVLSKPRRMPFEYEELKYVNSSGTFIDTLLLPNDENWKFVGSWARTGQNSSYASIVLHTESSGRLYIIRANGALNTQIQVCAYSNSWTTVTLGSSDENVWHNFELQRGSMLLDNNSYTIGTATNSTVLTTTLKIGSSSSNKIGEVWAYHNNELVADFVPCRHGEDVGFYDVVRNLFFTSMNSNSFTAGEPAGYGKNKIVTGNALSYFVTQNTGTSTSKVMSQSVVTDYVEGISWIRELATSMGISLKLPDGYQEVEYISNRNGANYLVTQFVPTNTKTKIYGSFRRTDTNNSALNPDIFSAYTVSSTNNTFMTYVGNNSAKINVACCNKLSTQVNLPTINKNVWFNFEFSPSELIINGETKTLSVNTTGGDNTTYFKIFDANGVVFYDFGMMLIYNDKSIDLCLIPCIDSNNVAGMYDAVNRIFYHESLNGVVYTAGPIIKVPSSNKLINTDNLSSLITQDFGNSLDKVMSLEAIRRELNIATNTFNITYLYGRFANFKFADYPQYDPRTADGISLVFACNNFVSTRAPLFAITNPNSGVNDGFNENHFAIWNTWLNLIVGFLRAYSGTLLDGGYSYGNQASLKHCVITYDFKTGISKLYKNGALASTKTPTNYSYLDILTYFSNCTTLNLSWLAQNTGAKTNGMAVFGHVLTDSEVQSIYKSGNDTIKNNLIQDTWRANNLHPLNLTDWNILINTGTKTAAEGGGYILTASSGDTNGLILFGFTGITNAINNCIYEWDFEITEGTGKHITGLQSRKMLYSGGYHADFIITDSNGNDVTTSDLVTEELYHVVCKPDNVGNGRVNAESLQLLYYLYGTSGYKMKIYPTLKITERGSALLYTIKNYKGEYFLQPDGTKMTVKTKYYYGTSDLNVGSDTYIEDTVMSTSGTPNFNGLIAVDTTNNKVYVGYLTSSGGTWKQINNS